jgi:hypothetical protein
MPEVSKAKIVCLLHLLLYSFSNFFPFNYNAGIAINHWYKVKVTLDPNLQKGEIIRREPEEGFANTPSGGHFDRTWKMGGWVLDPQHNTGLRETSDE